MIEVSIWTKENEKDYDLKKPIIQGVDNTESAIKLLSEPIFKMFEIWKHSKKYRDEENGLLESMQIYYCGLRYCFNDWYWD